jgi:hypothetical protein
VAATTGMLPRVRLVSEQQWNGGSRLNALRYCHVAVMGTLFSARQFYSHWRI